MNLPNPRDVHEQAQAFQALLDGFGDLNADAESALRLIDYDLTEVPYLYRITHDAAHTAGSGDGARSGDIRWSRPTENRAIGGTPKRQRSQCAYAARKLDAAHREVGNILSMEGLRPGKLARLLEHAFKTLHRAIEALQEALDLEGDGSWLDEPLKDTARSPAEIAESKDYLAKRQRLGVL